MVGVSAMGPGGHVHAGFEGKLPSRGDFVARGLPESFLAPWRGWMDGALSAARAALAGRWQSVWMEAPVWHFVLGGGVCGPDAVMGLWFPSVDQAGRHYPLTAAAVLEGRAAAPAIEAASAWLQAVEAPALDALAMDHAPDTLLAAIQAVPIADSRAAPPGASRGGWWWTDGAPLVPGVCLRMDALPDPPVFIRMLDAGYEPA
ncbi:MAG TPA: type VI secretion system-associated protein TagF [Rhodopila sp.]|nr:type VI secretion system-associated protein TagF [Rhodopila sp.]